MSSGLGEEKIPGFADNTLDYYLLLRKKFETASHEEIIAFYNRHAGSYYEKYWLGPKKMGSAVLNLFNGTTSPRILDIGAGSGMVGKELKILGFTDIDAMEPSITMLEQAKETGAYGNFYENAMGAAHPPADIPDGTYDVVTAAGIFTPGHVGTDAFPEIFRLLKVGGYAIITIRDPDLEVWFGGKFEAELSRLSAEGKINTRKEKMQYDVTRMGNLFTLQKFK